MNNPFDYMPGPECDEAYGRLMAGIEAMKESADADDVRFCRELEAGKMLGVLIAEDRYGQRHTLYAFSGQIGRGGFHKEGFVEPVFDYLQPDGYFKRKEREITDRNRAIEEFETGPLAEAQREYDSAKGLLDAEIAANKERCRQSKMERAARRESGLADDAEREEMTRRSQYEKAELHRLKKRAAAELEPYAAGLEECEREVESMRKSRRAESEALQDWLFSNFRVLNARGEMRSLKEIFATTAIGVPPSGAGECCAPKLLQGAYRRGWVPVAIAEYWYGKPKEGEVRVHGEHYPACRGKCLPVLGWMLQGLDVTPPLDGELDNKADRDPVIVYENRWFCVVDKPSGMLSVPGKGNAMSVQQWLAGRYGQEKGVVMAHRLDRDTSGLIIAAFGDEVLRVLHSLFATRHVRKRYVALLEGDWEERGIPKKGSISLPLSPDWLDRPRQRVDHNGGKEALTDYEFIGTEGGRSRVAFHPHTGRTHQLRVHSASGLGLGMPIVGDPLYGMKKRSTGGRLHLHAEKIEFTFPLDGAHYRFESPSPF